MIASSAVVAVAEDGGGVRRQQERHQRVSKGLRLHAGAMVAGPPRGQRPRAQCITGARELDDASGCAALASSSIRSSVCRGEPRPPSS